ncbi:hypothetical protein ACG91D_02075 [Acinetobacter guillouiae]|uniref:hypothetical protein n=1 Tax=Acinetobacter guillouiae TaxID=106649 RepID=UPI00125FA4C7|nr:hypothetical protein [Acinetobacter guillouiae]MDN5650121.1 hypothetical protein [Acinetobacter sp.]
MLRKKGISLVWGILVTMLPMTSFAAEWVDVGTLSSGRLPDYGCNVRLAAASSTPGIYNYLTPVNIQRSGPDLRLDFSNYTISHTYDFFINIPNNTWNDFYQSFLSIQSHYPNHVAKFNLSVYDDGRYLVTGSMVSLKSGSQSISVGTPLPLIVSHQHVKIQQLCL